MPEYLSPGVYVEEIESGDRPMEGVSTSAAGFLGLAEKGPGEGRPELVTSFSDFLRIFGGYLSEKDFQEYRYLAYAVEHFFINGGSRCYVMRVVPLDAKPACNYHGKNQDSPALKVLARNPGRWGNKLKLVFTPAGKAKTSGEALSACEFDLEVFCGSDRESYAKLSFDPASANYVEKKLAPSGMIKVEHIPAAGEGEPFAMIAGEKVGEKEFEMTLSGGSDGSLEALSAADFIGQDHGPGRRTGIQAFIDNGEVSIMAVPGVTDPHVQLALVAHCEHLSSRFAVLDIPRDLKTAAQVQSHRDLFDSDYAALYHPWLQVFDPLDKRNIFVPPSGSILGIFARTDQTRGVHKAPANEVVSACTGLDYQYDREEQEILNPKGINLIRHFSGQGIRVWGARTCSSNAIWKYVNVKRLFIFLEQSIKRGTNWVIFEPNDQQLWARVQRVIDSFLLDVWRSGALMGVTPDEAFFVKVDRSTMTQDDIDNGRLICIVGVAPIKPTEFIIFRIAQKTAGSE